MTAVIYTPSTNYLALLWLLSMSDFSAAKRILPPERNA